MSSPARAGRATRSADRSNAYSAAARAEMEFRDSRHTGCRTGQSLRTHRQKPRHHNRASVFQTPADAPRSRSECVPMSQQRFVRPTGLENQFERVHLQFEQTVCKTSLLDSDSRPGGIEKAVGIPPEPFQAPGRLRQITLLERKSHPEKLLSQAGPKFQSRIRSENSRAGVSRFQTFSPLRAEHSHRSGGPVPTTPWNCAIIFL